MGGAETWLMNLLRHWSATGSSQMHFLATGGHPGLFDEEVKRLGGRVHYLRYTRRNLAGFMRGYRHLLAEEKFDAIHDHSDLASGVHFLLGLGRLPPVRIAHVHNPILHLDANYGVSPSRRVLVKLGRALVKRLATDVCGTSAKSLEEYGFPGHPPRPSVAVLHCGINLNAFCVPREGDRASVLDEFGLPENALVVLFAGRLDRDLEISHPRNHKNSWLALLISRIAAERNERVHLLMAGAGEEQRLLLERQVARWGLSNRLRLIGVRRDIGRLMRAADTLLFPSAQEGLGMVAVEAQAAGTPVLASTAIPQEAVVAPELFRAISVTQPLEVWADSLLHSLQSPRVSTERLRVIFEKSPFSIINSAESLEKIYMRGSQCAY